MVKLPPGKRESNVFDGFKEKRFCEPCMETPRVGNTLPWAFSELPLHTCVPAIASDASDVLPAETPASDTGLKAETPKEAPASTSSGSGFTGQLTYPGDTPKQTSLTVDDVKIEGNRLVPSEDILGVVKTKRGDKFDRDVLLQDLKAINGMGYFDDRSLQALPEMSNGGVLLKIRVQENAPITQFSFEGNEALGSEDLSPHFC